MRGCRRESPRRQYCLRHCGHVRHYIAVPEVKDAIAKRLEVGIPCRVPLVAVLPAIDLHDEALFRALKIRVSLVRFRPWAPSFQ